VGGLGEDDGDGHVRSKEMPSIIKTWVGGKRGKCEWLREVMDLVKSCYDLLLV
jgi:hypothetical protein